mgnify:CR=1 FL=1|tara:strand:- start:3496 stop:4809 length:1314 start_codon:yes stop_codon:yes gene_type:complete
MNEVITLGDLAEFKNGANFSKDAFGEGFKVVNVKQLFRGRYVDFDDLDSIKEDSISNPQSLFLKEGDLLFARSSVKREGAGQVAMIASTPEKVIFSGFIIRCRVVETERCCPSFLNYALRSPKYREIFPRIATGTSISNLSQGALKGIEIDLPNLSNQKAIAHILGTLDDKIELNQKMNQTLEEIAKAIFKSWFVDFDPVRAKAEGRPTGLPPEISDLFPDEMVDSEIGKIPCGWDASIVSEFGKVVCGKTPSTKDPENFDGQFPFITIPDMRGNLLSLSTDRSVSEKGAASLKGKMLPAGSICVSCIATPGLVSVTTSDSFTNQQINSIVPRNEVDREYLLFSMMTFGDLISSAGSGGSVFANLSTGRFKELPILQPCEESRTAFSVTIRPMLQRIEISQKEISTLSEIRDTLLPKLISGEICIPDAEKFLEEAGI